MINVGYDGACLRHPRTGVGNYTYCLLDHLQDSDLSIHILDGIKHRSLQEYAGDYSGEAAAPSGLSKAPREIARKSAMLRKLHRRFVDFSFRSAVDKLDIYHATNFLPARTVDIPFIPLIHDVSHLRHPEWHPRERIELLKGRESEFAEAPVINTVSQFSANEIEKTLSIPAERIRITPPGTNPLYLGEPQQVGTVLAELDLAPGDYFLSVGTQEPRKNLTTLLSAYMDFCGRSKVKHPLVVVGPKGWGDSQSAGWNRSIAAKRKRSFPGLRDRARDARALRQRICISLSITLRGFRHAGCGGYGDRNQADHRHQRRALKKWPGPRASLHQPSMSEPGVQPC